MPLKESSNMAGIFFRAPSDYESPRHPPFIIRAVAVENPFEHVLRAWRPGVGIQHLEPVEAGATNTAARAVMQDGQEVFVKHVCGTPREQWQSQRAMMSALQQLGFPSLYPLFVLDENGVVMEVYAYRPDNTLKFPKTYICHEGGKLVAQLHNTPTPNDRPWPLSYTAARAVRETLRAPEVEGEAAFWRDFENLHTQLFAQPLRQVHCHGDLFYDNFLFVSETEKYLIDFEDSFRGPWMADIGIALMALGFRNGGWQADRVAAFLSGYEEGHGEAVTFPHLSEWTRYGANARSWWRLRHVLLGNTRVTAKRDWREYLNLPDVEDAMSQCGK